MKALFEAIDFTKQGLSSVEKAVKKQDWRNAAVAYLDYYRNRTPTASWWIPLYGHESFKQRSSWFDFFIEPPKTISWQDREKLKNQISTKPGHSSTEESLPYTVVDLADMMLENKLYHPWWPQIPPQNLGPNWDWDHIPPDGDQSWTIHMQRLEHLIALAQAYWLTDQEKYIQKMIALAKQFFEIKTDLLLEALNDIVHPILFQSILPFALSWDGFTPDDFCAIQFWTLNQANGMMGYRRQANQLVATGKTLVAIGLRNHEFKDADDWYDEGFSRIRDYLGGSSTYPDGSHKEPCFSYNDGSLKNPLYAITLADIAGRSYPEDIKKLIEKAAQFLAYTVRPDGLHPWMGNGRRGSALASVAHAIERLPDESLKYISTSGQDGREPEQASIWFPYAGYGIMRSHWGANAHYCLFDAGPFGIQHAHEDKLSVEIAGYGRSIIEDLGIHTYSTATHTMPLRNFFCNTYGHNTIVVDGKSQIRQARKLDIQTDKPVDSLWLSTGVCDHLTGVYNYGYGFNVWRPGISSPYPVLEIEGEIDTSVTHRRDVVFVKSVESNGQAYWIITDFLSGEGKHCFEQLFHLIPIEFELDEIHKIVRTTTPDQPNLALIPVLRPELELEVYCGQETPRPRGWYVGAKNNDVIQSPEVVFRQTGIVPVRFQTIVYPLKSGERSLPDVSSIGDGCVSVRFGDGCCDLYATAEGDARPVRDMEFDGSAALLRLDSDGKPLSHQVIGGTTLSYQSENLQSSY